MHQPPYDKLDALITNGRDLMRQAQEAIDAANRYFEANGIDPSKVDEKLRAIAGEEAVQRARAEVKDVIRKAKEDAHLARLHATPARVNVRLNRKTV